MTWLATKNALKKAWVWLRHHWHFPVLIVYTLVMWVVFRKNADAGLEVLMATRSSYKDQIKEINRIHEEEISKRNTIISQYSEVIDVLEKRYKDDRRDLTEDKKKRAKEIVEVYHEDPREMAKILAGVFGIEYEHYND